MIKFQMAKEFGFTPNQIDDLDAETYDYFMYIMSETAKKEKQDAEKASKNK